MLMSNENVMQEVIGIAAEVFALDREFLSKNSAAKDVPCWDSMTNLILIDALEKHFDIKLSLDDIFNADNLGDLSAAIYQRVKSR